MGAEDKAVGDLRWEVRVEVRNRKCLKGRGKCCRVTRRGESGATSAGAGGAVQAEALPADLQGRRGLGGTPVLGGVSSLCKHERYFPSYLPSAGSLSLG